MDCALESFRATVACCADSGLLGTASDVALESESARSTSSLTIRPPGPVPATCSALRPALSSFRRNAGEIFTVEPDDATEVAGTAAASGSPTAVSATAAPCAATKASTAASGTNSGAITPISCPTGNSAPISAKIRTRVPEVRASKLLTILSVSISTISSPAATVSPTFLCQATIVP